MVCKRIPNGQVAHTHLAIRPCSGLKFLRYGCPAPNVVSRIKGNTLPVCVLEEKETHFVSSKRVPFLLNLAHRLTESGSPA